MTAVPLDDSFSATLRNVLVERLRRGIRARAKAEAGGVSSSSFRGGAGCPPSSRDISTASWSRASHSSSARSHSAAAHRHPPYRPRHDDRRALLFTRIYMGNPSRKVLIPGLARLLGALCRAVSLELYGMDKTTSCAGCFHQTGKGASRMHSAACAATTTMTA